ncbi:hypothetical protein DPEC_G00038460 [Dallia pectoralis]|uniref:Uncharacterized protein n=1 Tax=Dallia pectoralis TaxID=75939 RepID=A0ACC2HE40_DALPE|nr:hypothetical protein DPEC_G00038460 [Dallia pectoralis]
MLISLLAPPDWALKCGHVTVSRAHCPGEAPRPHGYRRPTARRPTAGCTEYAPLSRVETRATDLLDLSNNAQRASGNSEKGQFYHSLEEHRCQPDGGE